MGTRPATAAAVPLVRDGCLESLRTERAAGWSCAPQARETAEGPAAISLAGSELPPQGLSEGELLLVYDPPDQPAGVSDVRELFIRFGLAAQSPALLQVFEEARRVSQYDGLPVLILGETGTGKQRLAEAIHQLNPRRCEQRFITVNCAAISETLAESTLFGHRRGAFTGAEYERLGAFRTADGGTLLLDEISDLDPLIQPKLLYVLQERRLTPVGEDHERAVDVRIIAATSRPLEQMVREGRFRADLYERLCGWRLRIPPLRERPDDIAPQAQYFLDTLRAAQPSAAVGFSGEALEAFRSWSWPGNTRQLENLVRATLAHDPPGPSIELRDVPPWALETPTGRSAAQQNTARVCGCGAFQDCEMQAGQTGLEPVFREIMRQGMPLKKALQLCERQLIECALQAHGGNRIKTAAALGISERGLFGKLKRYKLA